MKKYILMGCLLLSGCTAIKDKTEAYITEEIKQKIVSDVDNLLEKRGLSLKEIKQAADINNDGKITKEETVTTIKEMTKNYVLLEARNYVEKKLAESVASKGDVESKSKELWNWILGLIVAYLTKQIWSSKNDGKRDQRIAILEKLTGQDLDENGTVGTVTDPNKPKPVQA